MLCFLIFCNNRYFNAKRSCCLWQQRHLAQKAFGKLAFHSAFMCKVFTSQCDVNLLATKIRKLKKYNKGF